MAVLTHEDRQLLHRVAVARVDMDDLRDGRVRAAKRVADLEVQLGGDVLELREQVGVAALLRPQQLRAERRELGAAPALLGDERAAEEALPLAEQRPGVAVRKLHLLRSEGELSLVVD